MKPLLALAGVFLGLLSSSIVPALMAWQGRQPPAPESYAHSASLELVSGIELQPLAAQVQRLVDALDLLGNPLPQTEKKALRQAAAENDQARGVASIQRILDKHCLAGVRLLADNKMR